MTFENILFGERGGKILGKATAVTNIPVWLAMPKVYSFCKHFNLLPRSEEN